MKIGKSHIFMILLLTVNGFSCFATWTIIVADAKTKMIGIAGASCTSNVYGIGAIVPGKGAIVVQANANGFAKLTGFQMITEGAKPVTILEKLRQPGFDPENQQYAILCLNEIDSPVTYTGAKNVSYAGALTAKGISVQGNTLTSSKVLEAAFNAAIKAQKDSLSIQDILMAALEAGAKAGGDKRCGERRASSAFLIVSQPGDIKEYWLNHVIYGNDDHTPAVEALRQKFNDWKVKSNTDSKAE